MCAAFFFMMSRKRNPGPRHEASIIARLVCTIFQAAPHSTAAWSLRARTDGESVAWFRGGLPAALGQRCGVVRCPVFVRVSTAAGIGAARRPIFCCLTRLGVCYMIPLGSSCLKTRAKIVRVIKSMLENAARYAVNPVLWFSATRSDTRQSSLQPLHVCSELGGP